MVKVENDAKSIILNPPPSNKLVTFKIMFRMLCLYRLVLCCYILCRHNFTFADYRFFEIIVSFDWKSKIYDFMGQVQAKVAHKSASESGAPDDKI
jgi:hypothetical protein